MWTTPILLSLSVPRSSLTPLDLRLMASASTETQLGGLLLLGPLTQTGIQCIVEAWEMTSKFWPQMSTVPFAIVEVTWSGEGISLEEDE